MRSREHDEKERMPRRKRKLTLHGLGLRILRESCGWTQIRLARESGYARITINFWEKWRRTLQPWILESLAVLMGYSAEQAAALVLSLQSIVPKGGAPSSASGLSEEEYQRIRGEVVKLGLARMEAAEPQLIAEAHASRFETEREAADHHYRSLERLNEERWETFLRNHAEAQTWAMAERLCKEGIQVAGANPWRTLSLDNLALVAAERSKLEPSDKSRLLGYVWAFLGNALRITDDLQGADQAYSCAWKLWRAGRRSSLPLGEWVLLDLEASLRRAQRKCRRALHLHRKALALAPAADRGSLLLNRSKTYETVGNLKQAIVCLQQAAPLIDRDRYPRQYFLLHLNLAVCLALIGRHADAEALLPQVRALATGLRSELDLLRTAWVQAWVDLGLGRREEGLAGLNLVWKGFAERRLAYDAALASLEIAAIHLEDGQYSEVRALAEELVWIFSSKQIRREALAALLVFCEAVKREEATVVLARQTIVDFREAQQRHSA